jgi:hypothetical protein
MAMSVAGHKTLPVGDRDVIMSPPTCRPSRGGSRAQQSKDAFDWVGVVL